MAKKINPDNYFEDLFDRVEDYANKVRQIYVGAIEELTTIGITHNANNADVFSFDANQRMQAKASAILRKMNAQVYEVIQGGVKAEWGQANNRNDKLVTAIFGKNVLENNLFAKYFDHNEKAMDAFMNRAKKARGLGLSEKVWNYTAQLKAELETALDIGIGEGGSASRISKVVRSYLNEPEKLFKRVQITSKDAAGNITKTGKYKLSKAAQAYHPGQGTYRSSYKNAMRLTRTETNMAYHASDQERWQQFDFVVGYEVKLSNNHPVNDLCDDFAGKYPKEFKFVGWHPQCRCHRVAILATTDEFVAVQKAILNGDEPLGFTSKNLVKDLPSGYKDWIEANKARVATAKSIPYFIKDNYVSGDLSKGLIKPIFKPIDPAIKLQKQQLEAANLLASQQAQAAKLAAEQAAAEAAKIEAEKAVAQAKLEAEIAKKTEITAQKLAYYKDLAAKKIAEAQKLGVSGKELDALAAIAADDNATYSMIRNKIDKLNLAVNAQKEAIKKAALEAKAMTADPLSDQSLLQQFTQEEIDKLHKAHSTFLSNISGYGFDKQISKIEFEIDWLAKNGKYSTSQTLIKFLEKDLVPMKLKQEYDTAINEVKALIVQHSSIKDPALNKEMSKLAGIIAQNPTLAEIKAAVTEASVEINAYSLRLAAEQAAANAKLASKLKSLSQLDTDFYEQPDAFDMSQYWTPAEKEKVRALKQAITDAVVAKQGNLRYGGVINASNSLADELEHLGTKYLSKQKSFKHLMIEVKDGSGRAKYITDAEAAAEYKKYTSLSAKGAGHFSSGGEIGGKYKPTGSEKDRAVQYVAKLNALGANITNEVGLPGRYCRGSGFINNYILGKDRFPPSDVLPALNSYTGALSHALNKLPRYNGVTFRGVSKVDALWNELLEAAQTKKPFINKTVMSTATDVSGADSFGSDITFKIYGRSGVRCEEFSYFHGEKEVLFRAGSKFEIMEMYQSQTPNDIAGQGKWTVIMREILE